MRAVFAPAMIGGEPGHSIERGPIPLVGFNVAGDGETVKNDESSPMIRLGKTNVRSDAPFPKGLRKHLLRFEHSIARHGDHGREPKVTVARRRIQRRSRAHGKDSQAWYSQFRSLAHSFRLFGRERKSVRFALFKGR